MENKEEENKKQLITIESVSAGYDGGNLASISVNGV